MHTENPNWFAQTVIDLGARVRVLQHRIDFDEPEVLEREINTCEAQLQMLQSHAQLNGIDLIHYYAPFTEIKSSLELMKSKIERKKERERVGERRMGFWGRFVEGIKRILGIVGWIFGGRPRLEGRKASGYLGY